MIQMILCACGCGQSFEERKGARGAPQKHINKDHAQRFASRNYYHRQKDGAIAIMEEGHCKRYKATSLYKAERAFDLHIKVGGPKEMYCTNALDPYFTCPTRLHKDYDHERKLCLIYATLLDDLMWWKTPDRYVREYTTNAGYWL